MINLGDYESDDGDDYHPPSGHFCGSCCHCHHSHCFEQGTSMLFLQKYQENEDRKYLQSQLMHLDMIEIEIRKYELLQSAISSLSKTLDPDN